MLHLRRELVALDAARDFASAAPSGRAAGADARARLREQPAPLSHDLRAARVVGAAARRPPTPRRAPRSRTRASTRWSSCSSRCTTPTSTRCSAPSRSTAAQSTSAVKSPARERRARAPEPRATRAAPWGRRRTRTPRGACLRGVAIEQKSWTVAPASAWCRVRTGVHDRVHARLARRQRHLLDPARRRRGAGRGAGRLG